MNASSSEALTGMSSNRTMPWAAASLPTWALSIPVISMPSGPVPASGPATGAAATREELLLPLAAVGLFAAGIEHIEFPTLTGFNITGGAQIPPELAALWAGLSIYFAAFIAEIVRSAIEAVPKGQQEAARALGLSKPAVLFLVVLPQAARIMAPQLTSQYLNLIKSTTLGAAVAYPEIFQIFAGTVMNQAGKEIETMIIVMAIFLTVSLIFSAFMNWYNSRITLVER